MKRGRADWFAPSDLSPEQRALYDAIVSGPRARGPQSFALTDEAGRLEGPFNAMLYHPALGTVVQHLGSAIRYAGDLPARMREIAILELAVARRSDFEWYAHAAVGRDAGLAEAELQALRDGNAVATFDDAETCVRYLVRALANERDVDDAAFENARAQLGARALMEIVTLVGYYDLLALSLRLWRTPLPDGVEPVFTSDSNGSTRA